MGVANLNGVNFRIDPEAISYNYSIDYSVIDTLGGRVIQVLGATIGDITIVGQFGQDHKNNRVSWQLAESFGTQIRSLMDHQVVPPKDTRIGGVHQPLRFTYFDGVHNWDMKVLIKSYEEADGEGSIEHRSGKYSYGYKLTLFLVEDSTLSLSRVQSDKFIARIAKGLGWKEWVKGFAGGDFNGSNTLDDAIKFIQSHSLDGTYDGYVAALLTGQPGGTAAAPGATSSTPTLPGSTADPGSGTGGGTVTTPGGGKKPAA